jgi:hypothetical protein
VWGSRYIDINKVTVSATSVLTVLERKEPHYIEDQTLITTMETGRDGLPGFSCT